MLDGVETDTLKGELGGEPDSPVYHVGANFRVVVILRYWLIFVFGGAECRILESEKRSLL